MTPQATYANKIQTMDAVLDWQATGNRARPARACLQSGARFAFFLAA